MTKYRGELLSKESELQRLKRDLTAKTAQLSRMEESLRHLKSQLDCKADLGKSHSFCSFLKIND